jgi:hypothetical protein
MMDPIRLTADIERDGEFHVRSPGSLGFRARTLESALMAALWSVDTRTRERVVLELYVGASGFKAGAETRLDTSDAHELAGRLVRAMAGAVAAAIMGDLKS